MSEKVENNDLNVDLELEIERMKEFEEVIKEERVTNPEFYDLEFQANMVNEYLKSHPEIDAVELKVKNKKG